MEQRKHGKDLDSFDLVLFLWARRKLIIGVTALGAAVGGAAAGYLGLAHLALAGVPFVAAALALLAFGPHAYAAPLPDAPVKAGHTNAQP